MDDQTLKQALLDLPQDAKEPIVAELFAPKFLEVLGFDIKERVPQYNTGNGADTVDYAVRRKTEDDIFIYTRSNPYLLIELKGRDINLREGSGQYKSTVKQLKRYLLAPNCQTVKWGIITNSAHIQLFRKHGKVIHPASVCLEMTPDNVSEIIQEIRQKIENTPRALTVAVYNNKGGVGKTTTTVNLAAILAIQGKKTLIVDFDPNQQDLTKSLGKKPSKGQLYSCLEDKNNQVILKNLIHPYTVEYRSINKKFNVDIIPADDKLVDLSEEKLRHKVKLNRLHQVLNNFKSEYDYILIDSPPNWRFFSQSAIYASDVVLIPTKHNNIFSLENAAIAIKQFIYQIQQKRNDSGPIALPIFFNGEKITEAQKITACKAIDRIIDQSRKDRDNPLDLAPYFYPNLSKAKKNYDIFCLPSYAQIANAAFEHIPAVYKNKIARDYYVALAREYFLQ